jgi:nucleoside-diphosphate-sugar epimerase
VPGKPAAFEWAEAATHPLVVDATRAKERLGWRPTYTSLEALRDTLPSSVSAS